MADKSTETFFSTNSKQTETFTKKAKAPTRDPRQVGSNPNKSSKEE